MGKILLVPSRKRGVQDFDPVVLQCGVEVKFQEVRVDQNLEIRINAKKQDADVGHLSYVSDAGHLYMTVDVKALGASDAKEVADAIYDVFTQLTATAEEEAE